MTEKKKIEKFLDEYRDVLKKFQKWITTQSHLPQDIRNNFFGDFLCLKFEKKKIFFCS